MPAPRALMHLLRRNIRLVVPTALAAIAALVVGLYLFQPWRVFTNRTVVEALPVAARPPGPEVATSAPQTRTPQTQTPQTQTLLTTRSAVQPAPTPPSSAPQAPTSTTPPPSQAPPTPAQPLPASPSHAATPPPPVPDLVELARGDLISHEHTTTGAARLLRLSDGSLVLRLEGLDTSDGPDLRVWLTDAPVIPGRDGWFVFDDGRYVDLGPLAGNRGDQNYPIPSDVDVSALSSVSIWCQRFSVSFGAAELG